VGTAESKNIQEKKTGWRKEVPFTQQFIRKKKERGAINIAVFKAPEAKNYGRSDQVNWG